MARSIPVKFIALCLAALALLGVFSSIAGIVGLTAMDLYDNSVEELYSESMHTTRQNFAVNLAHRYASLQLGKLPEQYLNDYYGINWLYNTFQYGHYYYTIRNEHGEIVESTMAEAPDGGTRYEMAVTNIRYRAMVSIEDLFQAPDIVTQDPVPSEPVVTDPPTEPPTEPSTEPPVETTEPAQPITAPGETIPDTAREESTPTEPEAAETAGETLPEDVPVVTYDTVQVGTHDRYYDYELERFVDFDFIYADLPPYTVELYLLPGAVPEEYAWTLLRQVWGIRYQLPWMLCGCALIFAVLAVFLCCIAGRKKGQEEPQAGGLNRAPLELHLAVTAGWIFGVVFLCVEGVEYLLRYSPKLLVPLVGMGGYVACLSLVCFGFACAAQVKTPGGYWWKNSLIGRFFQAIARLSDWLTRVLGQWVFPAVGKACVWLWAAATGAVLWAFRTADRTLTFSLRQVGRFFRWLGRNLARYFGLLPLMWQWLVTGMFLLLFLMIGLLSDSETLLVLGICASLAIVLYGAGAFGLLLESVKKMSQGQLRTQVSSKHMLGSFADFSDHLNTLADVVALAAQKQLKSERMKTELITNVSHDIKTPLTSIINYVDLLQKPHSPEEQEQYLEVLARQSGQLKKLIEDLMEMSKASTGNMNVDIAAVDAAEAVNQALGEFADKLEKSQLTPIFTPPENPIFMKADGRLAWRVLSNLLSNVCKYALPGTRVYVDLLEQDGFVQISLKNISRQALNVSAEELLERFVRGDVSRNTEGSGLGLNIAQSLMELQNGKLRLTVDGDLFKATLSFPAARIE